MKKITLFFTLILALSVTLFAQKTDDQIMEDLFHDTYKFYQALRHTNGAYLDMVKLDAESDRGSSANIGMGLMSLCVGNAMGWEPNAEQMVVQTLKAILGKEPGFALARNAKGCFIHFYDINTGAARGSNWSTIDSDLMIGGALFAKSYFSNNTEIAALADEIFSTTDHSVFVGDVNKGQIALGMNEDGTANGSWTVPYNEYMIVAWFAMNQANDPNSNAQKLWDTHYASPENIKKCVYKGVNGDIPVLSPSLSRFTSMFTFMFNHNFIHHFSTSPLYISEMRNAMKADSAWWADRSDAGDVNLKAQGWQSYEWGTGAGVGAPDSKYQVDRICLKENMGTDKDQNVNLNVSPHILAGFSPAAPERVRADLLAMYKDPRNIGKVSLAPGDTILWKYSYTDLNWKPNKVEGVDYSCMFFGLASLPQFLGPEFFSKHNNFFEKSNSVKKVKKKTLKISPNPASNVIRIEGIPNDLSLLEINIVDMRGVKQRSYNATDFSVGDQQISVANLSSGQYLICVETEKNIYSQWFVKK